MCGCGPSVDTYGATLNVHDFVQCYAIEGLLVTPRVCRIYRRFTLLLLVLPQTTVFGATLNAKLRGGTLNAQWPNNHHHGPREMRLRGILFFRGVVVGVAKAN